MKLGVMLLHGMFGGPESWQACGTRLQEKWPVYVPELPILDVPYQEVGINSLVGYIKGMLDAEKIERTVLCGNSLGGHVALKLALAYPDRVAGLVLVGSSGLFDRTDQNAPRHPSREWVREKIKEVFFDEVHTTEVLVQRVYDTITCPEQARKVVRMARSAKHENLREVLPQLRCPVMLIWGADDHITPPRMAHEFKKCLPQAEMELIEQCGHAPNIERPREVTSIMERFLDGHCSLQSANGDTVCTVPDGPAFIEVRNLRREFDDGSVKALRGADFVIQKGEFVAIAGPSGSGKSTLLQLLGGLDVPTGGEVLFNGQSLSGVRDLSAFRARTIGFVFQSFHLLPTLNAAENVQVPMFEMPWPVKERQRRAGELLQAVGLAERIDHLPAKLSGGERQRVAIARSLANKPDLLLADEPTGNLDSDSARLVMDLLKQIHSQTGMTIIVVTHDPNVAAYAHRTLHMIDGRIVSDSRQRKETV
jgi:ABC-type lipoprotein export system ATPase subunit/pimeloyl-ACP methyl ester carboxylesterase